MGHDHGDHGVLGKGVRGRQRRALWIALLANAAFMVVEAGAGLAFNSLALLADAAHMLSDVAALAVALVAQKLADRPASAQHTFGLQRAEVLGAQANGIALLAVSVWIFVEATRRLGGPPEVEGAGLVIVATIGLAVNVVSAVLLAREAGRSLNMRGAFLHMTMDAAGSVGAIVAGLAVVAFDARWTDPAVSVAIGLLVLWSAWDLLRQTTHVLLEGTPRDIDHEAVELAIREDAAVSDVHHLHLWSLASDLSAVSAHVVIEGNATLHEAQLHGDRLRVMLKQRFGIEHATLELECHACDEDAAATSADASAHRDR